MDFSPLLSSEGPTETSGNVSGIEPVLNASDGNKPGFRISGDRLGGQVLYWRTMASVPGGPPMASGAAESDMRPAEGQEIRDHGARPRGPRVQLFREQPMSGSPDGAANGSVQASHPHPIAPPPDVVQGQSDTRNSQGQSTGRQGDNGSHTDTRDQPANQYSGSSGPAGMHTGMISQQQSSQQHNFNFPQEHPPPYQPDPLGIGPDGHNVHDHSESASWQGAGQGRPPGLRSSHSDMDSSPGFSNLGNNSLYEELRSTTISAGHESTAGDGQPTYNTGGSLGTGYIAGNIQILAPEQNDSFGNENSASLQQEVGARPVLMGLRLSPHNRGPNSPHDSLESGMYEESSNQDMSEEFMPLENDEPEGAGSSSQSNDDYDLEYEDNTEVDQDVVLQPEADQTGYENDDVEGQVPIPRASAFQPIAGGIGNQGSHGNRGNGNAPVYITPRTVPISIGQGGMVASGGCHGNMIQITASGKPMQGFVPQQQSLQGVAQNASFQASEMAQGNGNTNPEDDQVPADQTSSSGNHGKQVMNLATQSSQDQAGNNTQQRSSQGHELQEGAVGGVTVGPSASQQSQQTPKLQSQQPVSSAESSKHNKSSVQTSAGALSIGLGSRPKQTSDRPKSSTEPGTNAGKQHTGAVTKIPKTHQSQPRRTKIRTLPPKLIGASATAGRTLVPKSKAQNMSSSRNKPGNKGPQPGSHRQEASTRSQASTNAKSPNRVPPQRQAPSGGDSSTAPMIPGQNSQGHLQQAIQGGQYTLAGPQDTCVMTRQQHGSQEMYSMTRPQGIYLNNSMSQMPNRDHNRDQADSFMRPNPIGEIDAGISGIGPQNNGRQTRVPLDMASQNSGVQGNHVVMFSRQHPMSMPGPLIGHHVSLPIDAMVGDGDGEESSDMPSQPRQPITHHSMQQNMQFSYAARTQEQLLDRQVPGTSQANYGVQQPLPPLQIQPMQQPLQVRAASPVYSHNMQTNPNQQPQYSTNFYTHHLQPANQIDSSHNSGLQHNIQSTSKPEPYGAWERSLELSPISRTSTATDRVQVTVQHSPGASSNRDAGHNLSFNSALSDRQQQADQVTTNTDIVQMEHLRDQIRSMLRMTGQALPDSNSYDQVTDERSTPLPGTHMDPASTSMLLATKALSELAPGLGLGNQSSRYFNGSASGATNQSADAATLWADNQAIKVALEKERFRRKHCERQIQELQNRVMEIQQQLAVAVSTDRKKDLMIEQLDKTLVQVVDSWKKKETEKQQLINVLERDNEEMRTKQRQQQELQDRFEKELTETVDQLAQEQQRAKEHEQEKQEQLEMQKQEISRLSQLLEDEHQRAFSLETDKRQLTEEQSKLEHKYKDIRHAYEEDKENWEEKESEYLQKVEEITDNHLAKMDEEKLRYSEECKKLANMESVLTAAQNDLQKTQLELDCNAREKESLKVQMSLLEAKSESQLRKQEAELQSDFEKKLSERLDEERQQNTEREEETRERHHKQIMELTQRHSQETEMQLKHQQGDMWRCEDTWKREVRDRDDKIELLQLEIEDLKVSNKRLDQQRSEMTVKLQSMMQQHCNEALRLLQIGTHALGGSPGKQGGLFYSAIPVSLDQNNSLFSIPTSMTTQPVTMTTSSTTTNLRTSVLESVARGDAGMSNIEKYLQSLHQPQQPETRCNHSADDTSHKTQDQADQHDDFQPLSEMLDSSMTSELTQIPFSERTTNEVTLDTSFLSQISMPASHIFMPPNHVSVPASQVSMPVSSTNELPSLSELHNTVQQDSHLMTLVQSLPSTQTMMSLGQQSNQPNQDTQMTPQLSVAQQLQYSANHQAPSSQAGLYFHGNQGHMTTDTTATVMQAPGTLWHGQSAGLTQPANQNVLFGSNGPTIMLHPPVQRDHVTISSQSAQSLVDGSAGNGQSHVPGQSGDDLFELMPQNTSMNTTASTGSDWGYPTKEAGKNSFLSHILQQHMAGAVSDNRGNQTSNGQLTQEPVRLTDTPELEQVSDRFDEHESRQNELQHYIKMLLQRSPGSGDEEGTNNNTVQPQTDIDHLVTPPKKPIMKSVAFSKTTVLGPHGGTAPGAPGVVTMETSDGQGQTGTEPLGVLSPQQVGEISRLLGLYGMPQGPGTGTQSDGQQHNPPMDELLSYLRDLQVKNEGLSSPQEPQIPVRDGKQRTPPSAGRSSSAGPSARNNSPTRAATSSRAKKNLEQNYFAGNQGNKQVINIPTGGGDSSKQPSAKQSNVAISNRPVQSAATKPASTGPVIAGAAGKKTERKTASSVGKQGKGKWK